MDTARQFVPLGSGYRYPECPRWHDGRLWFSDQYGLTVHSLSPSGDAAVEVRLAGRPAGLGWDVNGDLLVVSMLDHALLRVRAGQTEQIASFTGLHTGPSNDMVVSKRGHAYVGNIGFDFYGGEPARNTVLTRVAPDGRVSLAADDLNVPNGMAFWDSEQELIVAESFGHQLTSFRVGADGELSDRSVFADLDGEIPDGMCLDTEGTAWFASIGRHEVVRVRRGGEVLERRSTFPLQPYACVLGGPTGRTLFICAAQTDDPEDQAGATGVILALEVAVGAF